VASSVPWDVHAPTEGKLSAHETLAKTLLLLVLASPGIPTLPQDVMEDPRHLSALAQCLAFRKAYAAHLTPRSFDPERVVHWHGATPGTADAQMLYRKLAQHIVGPILHGGPAPFERTIAMLGFTL